MASRGCTDSRIAAIKVSAVSNATFASLSLTSPADPVTPLNLPFDAAGNLLPDRVRPNQAGFGAANAYQNPRTIQAYIRFAF